MKAELTKQDLINRVTSTVPSYDIYDHPLVKPYGVHVGGFTDRWEWNDKLNELTEEQLDELYNLSKDSWKVSEEKYRQAQLRKGGDHLLPFFSIVDLMDKAEEIRLAQERFIEILDEAKIPYQRHGYSLVFELDKLSELQGLIIKNNISIINNAFENCGVTQIIKEES